MVDELVRLINVAKTYGKVRALDAISLTVHEREIVGLVGDNGAGKSTLVKILSGSTRADHGEITFRGKRVRIKRPQDAIRLGIETIHQDSALVMQLSVARNLFLGREPTKSLGPVHLLNKQLMRFETAKLLQQVGIAKGIDPDARIVGLSGGERQSIAIARAMYFEADLIILDEPTNNLGIEESAMVLQYMREAKGKGHSSIFITHNIHHVFQVVDRIVILRRGRLVADVRREETSVEEIEKLITGLLDSKWSTPATS